MTAQRLTSLDAVRGCALMGIFLVNFSSPTLGAFVTHAGSRMDRWTEAFIATFLYGKMYPLFALLFGLGIAAQSLRRTAAGQDPAVAHLRRMAALFVIGLLHALIVWEGDILRAYAITGVILLPLMRLPVRTLLVISLLCLPTPNLMKHLHPIHSGTDSRLYANYYTEMVASRGNDILQSAVKPDTYWKHADILGMALLGYCLGLIRLPWHVDRYRHSLYRWMILLAALVIAGLAWPYVAMAKLFFAPALSAVYGIAILLLVQSKSVERWLWPVVAMGRLSLTNYLTHTIIAAVLFFPFGFGWRSHLSQSAGAALACTTFMVQAIASRVLLAHYSSGPAEALWRWMAGSRSRFTLVPTTS